MAFKILFMGTPEFAVPILKSINHSKHTVVEVYTKPPKKKNRGQKILNSPIHEYAKELKILKYMSRNYCKSQLALCRPIEVL